MMIMMVDSGKRRRTCGEKKREKGNEGALHFEEVRKR